jgi:hypothetical protein
MVTKAVAPGSRRWGQLVKQGLAKDADRNWFLGDAALEIAPMGGTNANNGSEEHLRRYADEIDVAYRSLRQYRLVASAWPLATRVASASWKAHEILMAEGKRHLLKPGMTTTAASKAAGQKIHGRTGPESPTEDRASQTQANLEDPEVRQEVVDNLSPRDRQQLVDELIDKSLEEEDADIVKRGGVGSDQPIEPFTHDLIAEAVKIAGRQRGITTDVDRLLARAEPDQRPRLIAEVEPAVKATLARLDAGTVNVPDYVPDNL